MYKGEQLYRQGFLSNFLKTGPNAQKSSGALSNYPKYPSTNGSFVSGPGLVYRIQLKFNRLRNCVGRIPWKDTHSLICFVTSIISNVTTMANAINKKLKAIGWFSSKNPDLIRNLFLNKKQKKQMSRIPTI